MAPVSRRRNLKMPKPPYAINLVLPTQELLRENLLHLPIHIVQEHVSLAGSFPIPRHHRRREDRRHPPRRLREIPPRSVDHDQVPLCAVHIAWHIMQRQLALLVAAQVRLRRPTVRFRPVPREKTVCFAQLRTVPYGVRVKTWSLLEDGLNPPRVLLEE